MRKREAGLVDVRSDGSRRLYRVNFVRVQALRTQLDSFWGEHLEALRRASKTKR